jgi:hypothetical protein
MSRAVLTLTIGMPIISSSSSHSAFCFLDTLTKRLLYLNASSWITRRIV